jgi:hypothetical protein
VSVPILFASTEPGLSVRDKSPKVRVSSAWSLLLNEQAKGHSWMSSEFPYQK